MILFLKLLEYFAISYAYIKIYKTREFCLIPYHKNHYCDIMFKVVTTSAVLKSTAFLQFMTRPCSEKSAENVRLKPISEILFG